MFLKPNFVVFLVLLLVGDATSAPTTSIPTNKSKLPVCKANDSCLGLACGCCGKCNYNTQYKCLPDPNCISPDLMNEDTEDVPRKMSDEEWNNGKAFFDRVMEATNDSSWDWSKMNNKRETNYEVKLA